jgi:medium-chain acyl-[acyl-carrier-protein] hydrolase
VTSPLQETTDDAGRDLMARLAALPRETQAELLERLRRRPSAQPVEDAWLTRFRPNPDARLRLFCFPYAGGGSSVFRAWPHLLPPDVEVWGICPPGRENRLHEPSFRRLEPLICSLAEAVAPHLDREYVFFGHSMGALVAFELSRRLRATMGRGPSRLLLGAYRAPQLPNPNIRIHHLPDEVLKVVLEREGTPADVLRNAELMRAVLPTLRADLELCDTYEYAADDPLTCPLSVFGGDGDVLVRPADLEPWRSHTTAGFDLTIFTGSHFFLHSSQDLLLAALCERLGADRPAEERGDLHA